MLIGIISDSHDNMPLLKKAVEYFNSIPVDMVFHAGDLISPICSQELKKLKMPLAAVFGNNDGEKRLWREHIKSFGEIHERYYEFVYEGQKILMMHEPDQLEALALSQCYDVIIYGHTHKIDTRTVNKTLIINPGEAGGWLNGKSTLAILKLPQKEVEIIDLA